MKLIVRSIRNVLRSLVRLLMVVALLGGSLTFVAAMVSLNTSSQEQIATVQKQIGTPNLLSRGSIAFFVSDEKRGDLLPL